MAELLECVVFSCKYNSGGECTSDNIYIDSRGECGVYEEREEDDD